MDKFKIDILYGTVELQQRPVLEARGFGYESRSVWRDRAGVVQKISEWSPPLCWLRVDEQAEPTRPWWVRLFGAAQLVLGRLLRPQHRAYRSTRNRK